MAWIANARGRIIWANRRWREYVGTTSDKIGVEKWETLHDPQYFDKVAAVWEAALASGEPVEMSFPLRGANGRGRVKTRKDVLGPRRGAR